MTNDRFYRKKVALSGKGGVVEKVILAGSVDSEHFNCPEGGILIREHWDKAESHLLIAPYRGDWEDLELVTSNSE